MERWGLKACPRCGGNMFLNKDWDGWHEDCLQCSHSEELKSLVELKEQLAQYTIPTQDVVYCD